MAVQNNEVEFIGFALTDCTVRINTSAAKYLRAVHRTALELAIQNQFGTEVCGLLLAVTQIAQLRKLSSYYPAHEAPFVADAIDAYLSAQVADSAQMYLRSQNGR